MTVVVQAHTFHETVLSVFRTVDTNLSQIQLTVIAKTTSVPKVIFITTTTHENYHASPNPEDEITGKPSDVWR